MVEPQLICLGQIEEPAQVFVAAEDNAVFEIPSSNLSLCLVYLLASYYVFDVIYPKKFCNVLFLLQDFCLEMPDKVSRGTRYLTFLSNLTRKSKTVKQ